MTTVAYPSPNGASEPGQETAAETWRRRALQAEAGLDRCRRGREEVCQERDQLRHRCRRLEERLAARQKSEQWRRELEAIPTKVLSPAEKLVAGDLYTTLAGRAKHGNGDKPLYIEGATATATGRTLYQQ